MLSVQGFVELSQYVNNTPGVIASLGELSPYSRTFSKEKGLYQNATIPGYALTTFRAVDETGKIVKLPDEQALEILEITKAVVSYAQGHLRPYDPNDFIETIRTNFSMTVKDLGFGELVPGGGIALPSFLSWVSKTTNNEIRIWLADTAFQTQFTGYEITIISPLNNINDFFLAYSEVKAKLNEVSISSFIAKVQEAKHKNPDTITHVLEFDFYNRYDRSVKTPAKFGVLIYGQEGDYIDAMKDAIVEYLLTKSGYSEEQWKVIFPDIFKRTEMIIIPRWDSVAIENLTERSSLYSSLTNPAESLLFIENFLESTPNEFLKSNTYTLPFPLKTLMAYVVNGSNNMETKNDFKKLFPDYLPIPSTSLDFARMSLTTQNWVLFVDDLLIEAEKVTRLSPLPSGIRRVYRNEKLFVAKLHDGVNYVVAAKTNLEFK